MNHNTHEHLSNIIKDAPPVAVGTIVLFGVQLSDWVLILTAIYTVIRIARELYLWFARKSDDSDPTVPPR